MIRTVMFTNRVTYSIEHYFVNTILQSLGVWDHVLADRLARSIGWHVRSAGLFEQPSRSANKSDTVGLSSNSWLFNYLSSYRGSFDNELNYDILRSYSFLRLGQESPKSGR